MNKVFAATVLLVLPASLHADDEPAKKFYLIDGQVVEKRLDDLEARVAKLEGKTQTTSPQGKFSAGVKVCDENGCRYVIPSAVSSACPTCPQASYSARSYTTPGGGHTHTCPVDGTTWDHSVVAGHNCPTCGRTVTVVSGGMGGGFFRSRETYSSGYLFPRLHPFR